ncbi:MAG: histidine--tRNA ligase [Verrucomicrobiota bacterium]|nr:histidine--tRNA ligase [Verrucomicrobiota bacterium]
MAKTNPLPGTSDIFFPEITDWQNVENAVKKIFLRYGYSELRTPIFERTAVFTKGIGGETDIVQKEMYTFTDRGNRSLTLRPEGTAGVMRALADQGFDQNEEKRVYYFGPMFRGERPAAGRKRQFHQIGVECAGTVSPAIDAENIIMLVRYLEYVGLKKFSVQLNSRGTPEDIKSVAEILRKIFAENIAQMCEDCQRRLKTNVWRILDCKQDACQEYIEKTPELLQYYSQESREYFEEVCSLLDSVDIKYEKNPRLVRGLDYYVHTVFEVTHSGLGAQDAIAGGGRYLIPVAGVKKPVAGVGFALGVERLLMARESEDVICDMSSLLDVFLISLGEKAAEKNFQIAEELRARDISVQIPYLRKSMKSQMRAANKSGAAFTLILGEDELEKGIIQCRNMLDGTQDELSLISLTETVKKML